jgi:hypothetical protein
MDFIEWNGTIQQMYSEPVWHLVPPDDGSTFFYHNLYLAKGFLSSISLWIEHDPNLANAHSRYSAFNIEKEKEAVFERIRAERFPSHPSRLKALFVFKGESDVSRALNEWYKNVARNVYGARILTHSKVHVGDSIWLNCADWEEGAEKYWRGDLADTSLPEVIVHGTLYFPKWQEFSKLSSPS